MIDLEDKREIITLDDIKAYLLREKGEYTIKLAIITVCIFLFNILLNYLFKLFIIKIITVVVLMLGLLLVTQWIISIVRIKNNTYFKITTDILVDKREHIMSHAWPVGIIVNRLFFKYNKTYDISPRFGCNWIDIYNCEWQAVFDTAFVNDTFTLVETKKEVVLVFNNKLFDVKVDL